MQTKSCHGIVGYGFFLSGNWYISNVTWIQQRKLQSGPTQHQSLMLYAIRVKYIYSMISLK